ncbi:LOW QUALITY PROTEIN: Na(+)/H(+) exchange regulatory cofactor NHE-RF1 [Boleophthalmus pectinirostris]|uniref:LOW QUALITY PROTEIN: Na(+)/H(+) exchange regulatory cofactor NHE-RF1 n=1 Tax=Boleophthalmus pectinirostris TaxID=150288 RepID=UPI00243025D4|nr:LOW QUALITY PROTEIN: Na(+)/H(+) exchange regulatory cofactor NHE-RF1 [Boleophthalmus pectinirostris]
MSNLRPRRCVLEKGPDGYGFHLHGEKGKTGQFIRLVEPDTPASAAGLLAGDRLAFVNGESVEGESHAQVVARIRASPGNLELIVVDQETLELLKKHDLKCQKEYVTEGIPVPGSSGGGGGGDSDAERADTHSSNGSRRGSSPVPPQENGDRASQRSSVSKEEKSGPRPRLCYLKKGTGGYGFNLHSEKSRPGQFIRAVDDDSPAQKSGLRPNDKIVQVNGVSMVGKQHSDVVGAIKASGNEVRLLVVDAEADHYFSQCNVQPSEDHINGPLPEPRAEQPSDEEQQPAAAEERKAKTSVSSESSASSHSPQPSPGATPTQEEPESDTLGLGLSVAQARERAHQKRMSKNAPRMDWNKRKEVFSNL